MDVFFGWGLKFGSGSSPSVAMNANREMVLAYIPSGHQLACRQGTRQHATVAWASDQPYGDGREPDIAISRTHALGVHRGVDDDRLFYELGPLSNGSPLWTGTGKYDEGILPRIAINDSGFVLEVHQGNKDRLWYNVGLIDGNSIDWNAKDDFADGTSQSVSMNNAGQAIVAYERDGDVYYRLAGTDGKTIVFQAEHKVADAAGEPSVAVTDDGWFILCYTESTRLMQRVGLIDGTTVSWGDAVQFDDGDRVSVAAQNGLAVQVHRSQNSDEFFYSTSLITDRSRWMTNRPELGPLPLRELILPGSHDAGMYWTVDPLTAYWAQTQNKTIYQQLTYGMRFFDLRVADALGYLYIYHGVAMGPALTDVLDDVKRFMEKGARELVILKFTHFDSSFTADSWKLMVKEIDDRLGQWLYKKQLATGTRLADLTLNDYAGAVLVVVDGNWASGHQYPGFWVYRDAKSDDPAAGDLRIWDKYADTEDYETMKKKEIDYFFEYNGKCKDGTTDCDLFLLSWTLTPQAPYLYSVESLAHTPNQHLADEVGKLPVRNEHDKIINIAYVDYVQYARPSDVAIAEKDDGGTHG